MKKPFYVTVVYVVMLLCMTACADKKEQDASAPVQVSPADHEKPASPEFSVDVLPPSAAPVVALPQVNASASPISEPTPPVPATDSIALDPAVQTEVVQTPALRFEARAQAMRQMRFERAEQK